MKAVRRKTQATVERTWVSGVRIVDRAVINLDTINGWELQNFEEIMNIK